VPPSHPELRVSGLRRPRFEDLRFRADSALDWLVADPFLDGTPVVSSQGLGFGFTVWDSALYWRVAHVSADGEPPLLVSS